MLESAVAMAVLGLFGFFLSVANSRRISDLERRLRLHELANSAEQTGSM
jgi:hypothetical protein